MASRRPRVLFLCHSASRNGATILLAHFLHWLKDQVDWDLEVLVQGSGPLVDELRAAVPKTIIWRNPGPALDTLFRHSVGRLRKSLADGLAGLALPGGTYDLIYANTSAAAPMLRLLRGRGRAVLWHVHELSYALKLTLRDDDLVAAFQSATRFVAVSNSVKRALLSDFDVPIDRIDVVNGFVPAIYTGELNRRMRRHRLREELHLPENAFLVGACGSLGWRKGSDLFLQMAHAVVAVTGYEAVHFLWVGGSRGDKEAYEFEHDVRGLGLHDRCHWYPGTESVLDHFCAMDVFALTSREEPFALVMLEAAEQGVPMVCFEGAGGGVEFVGSDCGAVVPYLDINAFAAQILRLHDESCTRRRLGRCAQQKVQEFHRVEVQGPKLLAAAQQCMGLAPDAIERHSQGAA